VTKASRETEELLNAIVKVRLLFWQLQKSFPPQTHSSRNIKRQNPSPPGGNARILCAVARECTRYIVATTGH
jgi:hypothetical protein